MLKIMLLTAMITILLSVSAFSQEGGRAAPAGQERKILVAYFSKTNNTKTIAEQIHSQVGGDIFQVTTKKPYPADYRETTTIARSEQDSNQRPELAATIPADQMQDYDVIFLGYPIWWGTIPMAMFTFLEQYDLSGKTIVPFCTHEGSGMGRSASDIATLCPDSTVSQGLAIRGGSVARSQNEVTGWLRRLGYVE